MSVAKGIEISGGHVFLGKWGESHDDNFIEPFLHVHSPDDKRAAPGDIEYEDNVEREPSVRCGYDDPIFRFSRGLRRDIILTRNLPL